VKPSDQEAEAYIQQKINRLPRWLGNPIDQLRRNGRIWVRLLVSVLLILGGLFWFLPVLGLWMLPLGLILLIAEFPLLKRWLVHMAIRVERWWNRGDQPPT
jgi:hypothetical protein